MDADVYQTTYENEATCWWYVARRHIILTLIKKMYEAQKQLNILDVGCGTGIMLTYLKQYGAVTGIDVSTKALEFCKLRGHENLFQADVGKRLPFKKRAFDLIVVFDVLEHIEDDCAALREIYRVNKEGGRALITVPAYKFLWSSIDYIGQHKRRYTKGELKRKIKEAGFRIEKISYMNTFLFGIVVLERFCERLFEAKVNAKSFLYPMPRPINNMLMRIFEAEAFFIPYINLPMGSSLICVARRDN